MYRLRVTNRDSPIMLFNILVPYIPALYFLSVQLLNIGLCLPKLLDIREIEKLVEHSKFSASISFWHDSKERLHTLSVPSLLLG